MEQRHRRVRAKRSQFCPACGKRIEKNRDFLLVRFTREDWVHAREGCISSVAEYNTITGALISSPGCRSS